MPSSVAPMGVVCFFKNMSLPPLGDFFKCNLEPSFPIASIAALCPLSPSSFVFAVLAWIIAPAVKTIGQTLYERKRKNSMGVLPGDDMLYTLVIADDQVIITDDEDESLYIFRKLKSIAVGD